MTVTKHLTIGLDAKQPKVSGATFHRFRSDEKWLEERRKGIGGSDIAAVMGKSPWRSPLAVWANKTGVIDETEQQKASMEWGLRLEPAVLKKYSEEAGSPVFYCPRSIHRSKDNPIFCASLDGIVPETMVAVNAKTASSFAKDAWGEEGTDETPKHYLHAAQWEMFVLGTEFVEHHTPALFGGNDYNLYRVRRDEKIIAEMKVRALEFWEKVKKNEPPAVEDGSDETRKTLAAIHGEEISEEILEADDEMLQVMLELNGAKTDLVVAAERADLLKNKLCEAIGSAMGIMDPTTGFYYTWKWEKGKTTADGDRLRADKLFAKYSKTGKPTRVLRPHKPKGK